jgi:hypothetical protein
MRYYDHYHDPNQHLELTRRHEEEMLRRAEMRIRPGLLARLCSLPRPRTRRIRSDAALDSTATELVIRELRAVRQRLEALEASVQRLH